jgi:hypothetical protein
MSQEKAKYLADMAMERAKQGLRHYIKHAWTAAGLPFHGDNSVEVDAIVDDLVEAAVYRVAEQHASRRT